MILTTTNSIEGRKVLKYFDPVNKSIVLGSNIIADFGASVTDLFGGRSNNYESRLQSINNEVLENLKKHAIKLKADAVLGIKIDVGEISGGGKNMFMVSAIGTPVVLEKQKESFYESASTHELVNMKIRAKKLMQRKKSVYRLNAEEMSFVIQSGLEEFVPYIQSGLEKYRSFESESDNWDTLLNKLKKLLLIFENIPAEKSKEELYRLLEEDIHIATKDLISDTIIDLGFIDYQRAKNLLKSEDFIVQKHGLKILNQDKSTYSQSDIDAMKSLYGDSIVSFFSIAPLYEDKGLMGKKIKWRCMCGTANSEKDDNCSCGKNRIGFSGEDLEPKDVQELINDRLDILNTF